MKPTEIIKQFYASGASGDIDNIMSLFSHSNSANVACIKQGRYGVCVKLLDKPCGSVRQACIAKSDARRVRCMYMHISGCKHGDV